MPRKLLIVDESPAAKSMGSVKDKKKKRVLQIVDEDGKEMTKEEASRQQKRAMDELKADVLQGYANARDFDMVVEEMPFTNKKIEKELRKLANEFSGEWYDLVERYLKIAGIREEDQDEKFFRDSPDSTLNTYGSFAEDFGFKVVGSGNSADDFRATKNTIIETKDMLYGDGRRAGLLPGAYDESLFKELGHGK